MQTKRKWYDDLLDNIIELRFSDPETTLANAQKMYAESKVRHDHRASAIAKFYEGDAYLSLNELNKAIEPLFESIHIQKKYGMKDYMGKVNNVLGCIFYSQGDLVLALKYILVALEIAIEIKDYETQTYIYNNLAAILLLCDDFKNAHDYFEKAWKSNSSIGEASIRNQFSSTRMYLNLGICLNAEGRYEEAKENLEEILFKVSNEELDNISMYVWELAASLSDHLGEDTKAVGYALKMAENIKEKCSVENLNVTFECIRILTKNGRMEEAKYILDEIQSYAIKSESVLNELMVLEEWIEYYKVLNDTDNCQRCYQRYYELSEQNKSADYSNQLEALENRNLMTEILSKNDDLIKEQNEFEKLSTQDNLTGLFNRNSMKALTENLIGTNKKEHRIINLAIIDIDHFKDFNDDFGHLTGDKCLQALSQEIKALENEHVWGVRFGGDEFFMIGDNIPLEEWKRMLEQIVENVRKIRVIESIEGRDSVCFTVSIGSFCKIPDQTMNFTDYIHRADLSLYKVKQQTRNNYLLDTE